MRRARVLFLDDDPQIRRMMRTILTAYGFELKDIRSGGQAWKTLKPAEYDLVLLDLDMADASGIETCRAIRAESDVPIVALAESKAAHDMMNAFEAGADDYIVKPFNTPELLARISSTLRRRRRILTQPNLPACRRRT